MLARASAGPEHEGKRARSTPPLSSSRERARTRNMATNISKKRKVRIDRVAYAHGARRGRGVAAKTTTG